MVTNTTFLYIYLPAYSFLIPTIINCRQLNYKIFVNKNVPASYFSFNDDVHNIDNKLNVEEKLETDLP